MTTPQAAPADEAKRLVDEFGKAAIRCAKSATSANFDALVNAETRLNVEIDRLAALATQADTERANWKRWCEQAEAATQAEAPACPDPAGCLREGCNQNGDGSLCERYVEAEAPAAPAQAPHWFSYGLHCARQVDAANQRCAELQSKLDAALAATPAQTVAPAQANAADDLIHRLHAEANKADDVHADLMREAAEALAAPPAQPAPVVQPFAQGQHVRQQATATRYDYATVLAAHPNGALDVQADDGTRYGWAAFATELAPVVQPLTVASQWCVPVELPDRRIVFMHHGEVGVNDMVMLFDHATYKPNGTQAQQESTE